jgi:5-methylcytosine-specific restriction endonuclease McrA
MKWRRKKREKARLERSEIDNPYISQKLRHAAKQDFCLACGREYGAITYEYGKAYIGTEILDHIFPRRFLLQLGLEPNVQCNLASVCARCHGRKLKAEELLYRTDVLGFVRELRKLNWPLGMVREAAEQYGIREVVKLLRED